MSTEHLRKYAERISLFSILFFPSLHYSAYEHIHDMRYKSILLVL